MKFRMPRASLRTRIIAWSFIPTILILFAIALVTFYAYQRVTEDLVVGRNRELTRLSAGQLSTDLTTYADLLGTLARTSDVYSGDPLRQAAALKNASNRLVVFDAGVLSLNPFGQVAAAQPERPDMVGQDWSNRAYFGELTRSVKPVFSDITADGPQRMEVIGVAVPVLNDRGEFRGALIGMFRLGATTFSAFYGGIVRQRIGEEGTTYLVDSNGRVIYHSDANLIGTDLHTRPVVQTVLSREVGTLRTRDVQGADILASFAPVPGTPWGLITEQGWADLLASGQGYGQFLLLLLGLGVLVPAAVVAFGVRRITDPITKLIAGAKEVAGGHFGQEIKVRTGDELEELVRQFNRMSAQLSESYTALQEREERLALVTERANDGIWDWDLKTGACYFSPRWKSMLGYEENEVPDRFEEWQRLVHPEDRERASAQVQAHLEGRTSIYELEHRLRHKDGSYRWVLARGIALRDEHGIAYRMAGSHTDITERKRAEQALEERLIFEKLVGDISTEFINLGPNEIDSGIQHALQAIGEFEGVDRAYVFQYSGDETTMDNTHEWCAEGIRSFLTESRGLPVDNFPWLKERLAGSEAISIARIADLPPEAGAEREEFQRRGIQSLMVVPMVYRGSPVGFLGFDLVRAPSGKRWDRNTIALLRIVGETVVNALEHKRAQAIQAGQHQFLELLATGGAFSEMLHTLVRIIEEQSPGMQGLVLLVDEEGQRLHIGAAVSLPRDYIQSLEGLKIGPQGSPCTMACYRRERVIVTDIATDPRWDSSRDRVLKYGLRACWSEPVFSATGQVVGAFAMYFRQPRAPTLTELRTIETAAHLVGIAIEHDRAAAALRTAYQSLEQRVQERTHELATLNAIGAAVNRSLDLKEILGDALDKTLEIVDMEFGAAYRLEGNGEAPADQPHLSPLVYRGLAAESAIYGEILPLRGSPIEVAMTTGEPLIWEVEATPSHFGMKDALERQGIRQVASIPLMAKGRLVGALYLGTGTVRTFSPEQVSLLSAIGQQVGVAVENARLYEQAEQVAQVAERSRLARELHDSVTQSLYSVTLYAEAAARLLTTGQNVPAAEHLSELRDTAQEALREMRLLIFQLRPPALDKGGLTAALQARLDAVEARGGLQAELHVEGSEQLPRMVQEELYNIGQEALNNALKHAHAQRVQVHLRFEDTVTYLEVWDDGVGFEPTSSRSGGGFGISGMEERAEKIGGTLQIKSAEGQGTRLWVRVPMAKRTLDKSQELQGAETGLAVLSSVSRNEGGTR